MRKNVVQMKQIVEKMNLKNLTPDVELSDKAVEVPDISRPALQLTGFFERFDSERVQVIGYVEYSYLTTLEEKKKEADPQMEVIYQQLEERIKSIVGTKVAIQHKNKNKGKIEIEYYSQAELERLIDLFESIKES